MTECRFDPVLVFASRLAIVVCLAHGEPVCFSDLKRRTGLADGNLHVQAGRLAAAGLIESWKDDRSGRRRRTWFQITDRGRRELRRLVTRLELGLEQGPPAASPAPSRRRDDDARVW